MLNQQTNEATDVMNLNSDTNQDGLGIGQSSANINLDKKGKQFDWPGKIKPETLPNYTAPDKRHENYDIATGTGLQETIPGLEEAIKEAEKQEQQPKQGDYEQEMYNNQKELDNLQNSITSLETILNGNNTIKDYEKTLSSAEKAKLYNDYVNSEYYSPYGNGYEKYIKNQIQQKIANINTEMARVRNNINELINNKDYDDRTPDQKREDEKQQSLEERQDNSYQRAVADMLKAGINPASLQGGAVSGGGGSTGGSKSEEEEEKRKRKKREEEARRAAEEEAKKRQIMQVLGAIGGMATMLGSANIRAKGMTSSANIRANKKGW